MSISINSISSDYRFMIDTRDYMIDPIMIQNIALSCGILDQEKIQLDVFRG